MNALAEVETVVATANTTRVFFMVSILGLRILQNIIGVLSVSVMLSLSVAIKRCQQTRMQKIHSFIITTHRTNTSSPDVHYKHIYLTHETRDERGTDIS